MRVIVSWGIEPAVLFKGCKDAASSCLLTTPFDYCPEGQFCQVESESFPDESAKCHDTARGQPTHPPLPAGRRSHSLLRRHICEYWWHRTSLISETHHTREPAIDLCPHAGEKSRSSFQRLQYRVRIREISVLLLTNSLYETRAVRLKRPN